ncbi:hypothetical protein, partial [Desulfopila sp. IMCC35006]|uniref:hypothetical protein n=1 Tax=Desulfopila sp. IMCC35006 TaxID=2569542 RepID=UPI00197A8C4D
LRTLQEAFFVNELIPVKRVLKRVPQRFLAGLSASRQSLAHFAKEVFRENYIPYFIIAASSTIAAYL